MKITNFLPEIEEDKKNSSYHPSWEERSRDKSDSSYAELTSNVQPQIDYAPSSDHHTNQRVEDEEEKLSYAGIEASHFDLSHNQVMPAPRGLISELNLGEVRSNERRSSFLLSSGLNRNSVKFKRQGRERQDVDTSVVRNLLKDFLNEKSKYSNFGVTSEEYRIAMEKLNSVRSLDRDRSQRPKKDYTRLINKIIKFRTLAIMLFWTIERKLEKFNNGKCAAIKGNKRLIYKDTYEDYYCYIKKELNL